MRCKYCGFLVLAGICLLEAIGHAEPIAGSTSPPGADPGRPPNIVLLIGDDHGWPYYGFMGSKTVQTPNLDQLAREGTSFSFAHSTCSLCRPSLATLLTGLYPVQYYHRLDSLSRDKVIDRFGGPQPVSQSTKESFALDQGDKKGRHSRSDLSALAKKAATAELFRQRWSVGIRNFRTLPRSLGDRGYVSFEGGKYWEGDSREAGFTEGMSGAWSPKVVEKHGLILGLAGGDGLSLGRETMEPMFDFIRRHRHEQFFVWYAPMLPHGPFNPPEQYLSRYRGRGMSPQAEKYFANCTWFDAGVGQLLAFLEKNNLRSNTLLVYVNDNGWEQPLEDDPDDPQYSSLGGSHGKASLHDFGFRTPIIFSWPGHVPAGIVHGGLVSTADIFPTVLDFAQAQAAPGLPGVSLRPTIESREEFSRDYVVGTMHQLRGPKGWPEFEETGYYLRTNRWHYIVCKPRSISELYDMQQDPEAKRNVVAEHQELAANFDQKIDAWRKESLSSLPE
jgi:arylsulfatase A